MKWKQSVALILAASCVVMTGCRESEVIQNVVLTEDASEVDDTQTLSSEEQEKIDEMAQFLSDKQQEETKSNSGTVDTATKKEGEAADSDSGTQTGAEGEDEGLPGGGSAANSGNSDDTAQGPDSDDTTDEKEEEDEEKDEEEDEEKDEEKEENQDPVPGSVGRLSENPDARQVYDADGNIINLPEFVTSAAAPGEAGLIVQMLGGEGMLVASSEDLLSNSLAQEVFADEGISNVVSLWDKDGNMSDGNFQKLLEMHPDCVIVCNDNSSLETDYRKQKLDEADIPVMKIASLSSAEGIEQAVLSVGKSLGDNTSQGGLNSWKLAQDYVSYEQDLVGKVSGKNGISSYMGYNFYKNKPDSEGTYSPTSASRITLYIDGWDDDAYLRGRAPFDRAVYQSGLAYIDKDYDYHAMTYYLSNAGIVDAVSQFSGTGTLYLDPTDITKYSSVSTSGHAVYNWNYTNVVNQIGGFQTTYHLFSVLYAGGDGKYRSNYLGFLGDKTYPAVLVSSQEIKDKLEASKNSSTGLYRPGIQVSQTEELTYYYLGYDGMLDYLNSIGSNISSSGLSTNIGGDYDVYVNPCGVGSWTDGSVEGFLETIWASSQFYKNYSPTEVNNKIKEFYQRFYRHDLTGAQLDDILDGL